MCEGFRWSFFNVIFETFWKGCITGFKLYSWCFALQICDKLGMPHVGKNYLNNKNVVLPLISINHIIFYSALTPEVSWPTGKYGDKSQTLRMARARQFQQSASLPPVLRNAEQRGTTFPRMPPPQLSPTSASRLAFARREFGGNLESRKERESIILQRWRKPDAAQMWETEASQQALKS